MANADNDDQDMPDLQIQAFQGGNQGQVEVLSERTRSISVFPSSSGPFPVAVNTPAPYGPASGRRQIIPVAPRTAPNHSSPNRVLRGEVQQLRQGLTHTEREAQRYVEVEARALQSNVEQISEDQRRRFLMAAERYQSEAREVNTIELAQAQAQADRVLQDNLQVVQNHASMHIGEQAVEIARLRSEADAAQHFMQTSRSQMAEQAQYFANQSQTLQQILLQAESQRDHAEVNAQAVAHNLSLIHI